jgi:hypothetical protein
MDRRWAGYLGAGYLLLTQLVTFNVVLMGWPVHFEWMLRDAGAPGLRLLAVVGVGVLAVAILAVGLSRLQWWQIITLSAWMAAPALSVLFLGSLRDGRFWTVALASAAVGFAGVITAPDLLRRVLFGLGWFYGWGSVAVAVSQLLFGMPVVLVGGDPRYGRWLSAAGLPVTDVSSLNGLAPGRIFLAMNCGLLLVYVVRHVLRLREGWRGWIMPVGLLLALGWSFGRVGFLAVVVGLVATLVPWERWRPIWPFLCGTAVFAVPVALSWFLSIGQGTTQWRFDLWHKYLSTPGVWAPFGIGPQDPPDPIRGHAHNQLVETLASGGWIGVIGLLLFLYLGFVAAARIGDNRATYGVLFAVCAMFASDILSFAPTFTVLNSAFVISVSVTLSAASPPHHRLLRETPDPAYG